MEAYSNSLIFGKDTTERIVSCEIKDGSCTLFIENNTGIATKIIPCKHLIFAATPLDDSGWYALQGDLHYKYVKSYTKQYEYWKDKNYYANRDIFTLNDSKEEAMISKGFTYYKGLTLKDVSTLSFDIETTGLFHNEESKILLISNTYRKNGDAIRKLFAYDEYESEKDLIEAWCGWVREINPSIILGHNIFTYDIPYINFCAKKAGIELLLGRDKSALRMSRNESKFRFDGSQDYEYKRCFIYGREIVDTMFLSMKYDFQRKYENYKLKTIIKQENLEIAGRQHYDAGSIKDHYTLPTEWAKIKLYAMHDADDALALFDLMAASYFYYNQSIPKSFQSVMYSASGSQINSFLTRSYLQIYHSLPKANEGVGYEGAISFGRPGVYKNVFKIDVASLYPSIMIEWEVYDKKKDPKEHFLSMVKYFTQERLKNKQLGKETGNRYYKDVEQAQKIVINSAYGMMGAPGLLFNSPENASFVTGKGRDILQTAIDWAEKEGFLIANADTDSISISKQGGELSPGERSDILKKINALYPEKIHFEDDGYFPAVLILKAKNYALFDGKKTSIKGSALKSSKIEPALKEFMGKAIQRLLQEDLPGLKSDYFSYVKEIHDVKDIGRWSSKKTVSEKVINSNRTTEKKIFDAVKGENPQMGDKYYLYFCIDDTLKLAQNWTKDHDTNKLYERLHSTLSVFENVLDVKPFPNFSLKGNQCLLDEITDETQVFSFCQRSYSV